jgi:hypothetical protein
MRMSRAAKRQRQLAALARAKSLSPEERKQIAREAALARWNSTPRERAIRSLERQIATAQAALAALQAEEVAA